MSYFLVALIARMTANGAFNVCLQYSSEIFPTVIRGKGVAVCEIVGGAAIFLSPTIVYLSTFSLPETAGKALPQTLKDGQEFGTDQTWWDAICIRKHLDLRCQATEEKMAEEALEKLMLPRVVSHVSMQSQSIV